MSTILGMFYPFFVERTGGPPLVRFLLVRISN